MARSIPVVTQADLQAASASEGILVTVTITHPRMDGVVRLVADDADIIIDGHRYHAGGFEISVLEDTSSPPVTQFAFPNVDPEKVMRLETETDPAEVAMALYSTADFDLTVEPRTPRASGTPPFIYQARRLELTDVTVDASRVEGRLMNYDPRQEAWPPIRVSQGLFAGVFLR